MSDSKRVLAGAVVIDHRDHQVRIDGVRLPWWLAVDGPTIEQGDPDIPVCTLNLPVVVEGVVTIILEDGTEELHDPMLGNVREWARNYVRSEFRKAYPDLEV